jgi:hypothetical protein
MKDRISLINGDFKLKPPTVKNWDCHKLLMREHEKEGGEGNENSGKLTTIKLLTFMCKISRIFIMPRGATRRTSVS